MHRLIVDLNVVDSKEIAFMIFSEVFFPFRFLAPRRRWKFCEWNGGWGWSLDSWVLWFLSRYKAQIQLGSPEAFTLQPGLTPTDFEFCWAGSGLGVQNTKYRNLFSLSTETTHTQTILTTGIENRLESGSNLWRSVGGQWTLSLICRRTEIGQKSKLIFLLDRRFTDNQIHIFNFW